MSVSSVRSAPPLGPRTTSTPTRRSEKSDGKSQSHAVTGNTSFEEQLSNVDPAVGGSGGTTDHRDGGKAPDRRKIDLSA